MAVHLHCVLRGEALRTTHQHHKYLVDRLSLIYDIAIVNRMCRLIRQSLFPASGSIHPVRDRDGILSADPYDPDS